MGVGIRHTKKEAEEEEDDEEEGGGMVRSVGRSVDGSIPRFFSSVCSQEQTGHEVTTYSKPHPTLVFFPVSFLSI